MKKLFVLYFSCFVMSFTLSQVVVFNDSNFKSALVSNYSINTNNDSEIQVSEAMSYSGSINVSYKGIVSLVGIESFTKLTKLHCTNNYLNSIDLSKNLDLNYLDCSNNVLTGLDLSSNLKLDRLECYNNHINELNLKSNTMLTYLDCGLNQLVNLDIIENVNLNLLAFSFNQITSIDLSKCLNLTELYCESTQLNELSLINNHMLSFVICSDNSNLSEICLNQNHDSSSWIKDLETTFLYNCGAVTSLIDNMVKSEEIIASYNLVGQLISPETKGEIMIVKYQDGTCGRIFLK